MFNRSLFSLWKCQYESPIMRVFLINVVLLLGAVFLMTGCNKAVEKKPFKQIELSPCAKFECSDYPEERIFVTSEIRTLSTTFSSLVLIRSDKETGPWLYRITFNCREIYSDGSEITVIIGTNALSIDGVTYSTPESVPFEKVIDVFASKYTYFSKSYYHGNN